MISNKQGRPRKPVEGFAGLTAMLAGEWAKVCRGLVKVTGGRRFLARPEAERVRFFTRLALIACTNSKPSLYELAVSAKDGKLKREYEALRLDRLRQLAECYDAHPAVTLFALKRLRARIAEVNAQGRESWKAWLGYFHESLDHRGRPQGKLAEGTREALSQMRKVAVRNKTRRRATNDGVK